METEKRKTFAELYEEERLKRCSTGTCIEGQISRGLGFPNKVMHRTVDGSEHQIGWTGADTAPELSVCNTATLDHMPRMALPNPMQIECPECGALEQPLVKVVAGPRAS